jgi:quinoprotein glucose dehydrogenase
MKSNLMIACAAVALAATTLGASPLAAQEWRNSGGGKGFDRYSPLAQINKSNVGQLKVLWNRPAIDPSLKAEFPDLTAGAYLRGTPIVVGDVLYVSDGVGLVEAFDALTGQTKWVQKPFEATMKEVAGNGARGVQYWRSGSDERIVAVKGEYLYALNAKDGSFIRTFGDNGRVSLHRQTKENANFSTSSGPLVVGDVVVIGGGGVGGAGDGGQTQREASPENIRAYDVRTGALLWTFHIRPEVGEPGRETWLEKGAEISGHMGAWAPLSADEKLGYVYIPLTSPTNAFYGGHRPGNNLYANSLLVLNAKTGKYVWHFQTVHHDLWDYDLASAPTLGTLKVDGKKIDAVIQPSKTGYLYVFDRKSGQPVWPIVETPVPQSDVPGEKTSPTQPIPSNPPPFDRVNISEDDLIDFTPQLKAEALAIASRYKLGPIFSPPPLRKPGPFEKRGVLVAPGVWGTGNWNTGAFDPETGYFYAVSMTQPSAYGLVKPGRPDSPMAYYWDENNPENDKENAYGMGPRGLPLLKPPYGRLTAYDMNKGDKLWVVANGDGPRNNPELKDLNLPPLGSVGRPAPLVTKTLLFLGESSDSVFGAGAKGPAKFRAYDKATGEVVWTTDIPAGTTGGPMTYSVKGKQIIIVPVGGSGYGGSWIAMGLSK